MDNDLEYPKELYSSKREPLYVKNVEAVSEEDIAFFHTNGYLAIQKMFSLYNISTAKSEILRLICEDVKEFDNVQYEEPNLSTDHPQTVRKLMGFIDHSPHLSKMAAEPALINLVAKLSGDDEPVLFQDMALLKGPGGREKPWHQDAAYFDLPIDTIIIGVWIALDPATEENGCLHVIPKTHKNGPAEHFHIRDWQLCDTEIQTDFDVAVPLDPGGCLLWNGLLHHGSPKNNTLIPRQALQFHYRPKSCTKTSTEERMKYFGGSIRGATC